LRTGVKVRLFDVTPNASSCKFALPLIHAPAVSSLRTTTASAIGIDPASRCDPPLVGRQVVSMLSFTANGTPASAPSCGRARQVATAM